MNKSLQEDLTKICTETLTRRLLGQADFIGLPSNKLFMIGNTVFYQSQCNLKKKKFVYLPKHRYVL